MPFKNRFLTIAVSAAGVSASVQVLAFLRQVLIAAYFGVGRDFDSYVMVYALASVVVFTFGSIFDSVAVPHLVRARESEGLARALATARSIFRLSLWLSGGMSVTFLIAIPLLTPIFATGFSPPERAGLAKLGWYFLPWTLICVPYYAAAARHKMEWHFHRVFLAEIVIVAVSIGFVAIWHNNIQMLPLAYATGYAFGLLQLVIGAGLLRRGDDFTSRSVRPVMRNIAELFFANQTGGLTTLVDRHIQSFLVSGGVGAVNYSGQITTSLLNLLSFREIFVVPLTQQTDRVERLERLMSGLVLLAVPISGVVACFAPDILLVLLQRGRFDASATALTAAALRIGVFSLVPAALALPLARMFQIIDRIHSIHVVYLSLAGTLAVFGYLFVIVFGWGVRGVALMQLASSIVNALVCSYLVARYGIRFSWRPILARLTLAALVSVVASAAAIAAASHFENVWMRLTLGGTAYWLIVLLCYFLGREQLRGIAFGPRSPQDRLI